MMMFWQMVARSWPSPYLSARSASWIELVAGEAAVEDAGADGGEAGLPLAA